MNGLESVERLNAPLRECVEACAAAHALCTAAVAEVLTWAEVDPVLVRTLIDCAEACGIARDFVLRGSPLAAGFARGCAHACGSAASAGEKLDGDPVMEACAAACRTAMHACRAVGGPDRHQHG